MPEETIAIARVPLARARIRLVAGPLLLLATAGVAAGGGLRLGSTLGIALVVAAGVLALLTVYLAIILLTVRLEVEVASLEVRWLGGSRRYQLARGPVTRVHVRGEGAARLRPRFGALGWAIGPARLRDDEGIEVVQLARAETLILVPTDKGRLGIATTSEHELIAALGAAARVQQRLDAAAGQAATGAKRIPGPAPQLAGPSRADVEAHVMTGIERAQLEERLAAERAAALAAAEAERLAGQSSAVTPSLPAVPGVPGASVEPLAAEAPAPEPQAVGRRARRRATYRRPAWAELTASRAARILLAALPAVAAAGLWAGASVAGALPAEEQLRSWALATVLAGAGLIGSLMAVRWFPRLLGLVSMTSLVALVLIGRALFG